jgi:hypothetical protein
MRANEPLYSDAFAPSGQTFATDGVNDVILWRVRVTPRRNGSGMPAEPSTAWHSRARADMVEPVGPTGPES